ncbi:MAG: DUF4468 domain-containing protein [Prevotella sp.]
MENIIVSSKLDGQRGKSLYCMVDKGRMYYMLFSFVLLFVSFSLTASAQTVDDNQSRLAVLQAEAEAKAKAAQEAAKAAQEAAKAAQEAAEAAAAEARKAAEEEVAKARKAAEAEVAKARKAAEANAAEVRKAAEKVRVDAVEKTDKAEVNTEVTIENKQHKENSGITDAESKVDGVNNWKAPEESDISTVKENTITEAETELNDKYLALDAVPVVDGDVCWKLSINVPGKSSSQIYKEMLSYYNTLTKGKDMLERSKIALVNENEHKIAVVMQEWLVFSHTFISLDRAELNYVLQTVCTDEHLEVIMQRVNYTYTQGNKTERYKAEEWITDDLAVNKKHTRLYPICGKFRKKTIDRKDELFKDIKAYIL